MRLSSDFRGGSSVCFFQILQVVPLRPGVFCDPYWVTRRKAKERLESEGLLAPGGEDSSSDQGSPVKPADPMAEFRGVAEIPAFGAEKPKAEEKKGFLRGLFGGGRKQDAADELDMKL